MERREDKAKERRGWSEGEKKRRGWSEGEKERRRKGYWGEGERERRLCE